MKNWMLEMRQAALKNVKVQQVVNYAEATFGRKLHTFEILNVASNLCQIEEINDFGTVELYEVSREDRLLKDLTCLEIMNDAQVVKV